MNSLLKSDFKFGFELEGICANSDIYDSNKLGEKFDEILGDGNMHRDGSLNATRKRGGFTFEYSSPVITYTPFNINWDNLSSEDQDIADALTTQTNDSQHSAEQTPQGAQIETPAPRRPSFIAADAFIDDYSNGTQNAAPSAPPITPNGQRPVLPSWGNLTAAQKQILEDTYGIDNAEDYNELLNDSATAEGIAQDLGCKGVM